MVSGGLITGYTITNTGSGYTTAPTIVFNGGGGSGAVYAPTIASGIITAITQTNAGGNYKLCLLCLFHQQMEQVLLLVVLELVQVR
jgi:hypothetical protein